MSEELKACPFCGREVEAWEGGEWGKITNGIYEGGTMYYAGCDHCVNAKGGHSPEEAAKRWNTRPIEDALRSRVEELEAIIKAQKEALDDKFFSTSMQTIDYQNRAEELGRELGRMMTIRINQTAEIARLRERMDGRYIPSQWRAEFEKKEEIIADLEKEIARLREMVRWIPVGERLPENYDDVLIYDTPNMDVAWYGNNIWHDDGLYPHITHWKPLPEPPEVRNE